MRNIAPWLLAATLGIPIASCASAVNKVPATTPSQTSASAKLEQTMTTSLTAEDIGHRVLTLIEGLHDAPDISPASIEEVFGMPLVFNANNANDYGYDGTLTAAWKYSFGSIADSRGDKPTQWSLSFDNQTHDGADMAPICTLDFDDYAKSLTDSGFKASPYYGEHGRLISWDFARGRVAVKINIRGESDAKPTHNCVSILTIEITGA